MKNKQNQSRYQALINFMHEINKECDVFQNNQELEEKHCSEQDTLKKYYHTYNHVL